jgi:hypothetical protein
MFYPCSLHGEAWLPPSSSCHSCFFRSSLTLTLARMRVYLDPPCHGPITPDHLSLHQTNLHHQTWSLQHAKSHHHLSFPSHSTRHAQNPPLSLRHSRSPLLHPLRISFVHRNQPIEGTLTSGGKVVAVVVAESIRCDIIERTLALFVGDTLCTPHTYSYILLTFVFSFWWMPFWTVWRICFLARSYG